MNQTFSGVVLLGAVLLCALVLFVIGLVMKPKTAGKGLHKSANNKMNLDKAKPKFNSKAGAFSKTSNEQLLKLKNLISKNFPDITALMREHHLVLERNAKKVALLTLDVNAALGRRRLGEVTVINFHKLPSVEELRIELSGV
ncbi:hypothetical protein [Psychrobacter sp. UBA3962]|uniref:hypothetical protein n=1 Tax=Psychrobacter sp. UBA3962 TaxID=1947352 RepID=UPI0025FACA38|nr:hypothetical protein [Psychrobacter sp. UBA3962]